MVELYDKLMQSDQLCLIAGPCVIENDVLPLQIASEIKSICDELGVFFIFKASYKKANRSSAHSFTGIGDKEGIEVLHKIKSKLQIPITTDVHSEIEVDLVKDVVDIIQIPAFLCRQTELLQSAGRSGKIVNVKKGQFVDGYSMRYAVEKVQQSGNGSVILTERGNSFGYQDLVVDYRNVEIMADFAPVVMDCTHALQRPNQPSGVTSGQPQFIRSISKAAVAVGCHNLFIETHPTPTAAKSDGANMLPLNQLRELLEEVISIHKAVVK